MRSLKVQRRTEEGLKGERLRDRSLRAVRGDVAAVPRPRFERGGAVPRRGAPEPLRVLPETLPLRSGSATLRPAGGDGRDAAGLESAALRAPDAASLADSRAKASLAMPTKRPSRLCRGGRSTR